MKGALIAGVAGASVAALFAVPVVITGEVFVPGNVWATGYFRGGVAYLMACAWLALGASALFAGLMVAYPENYFRHRKRRDISFVLFGALFLAAVIGSIVQRVGPGAP